MTNPSLNQLHHINHGAARGRSATDDDLIRALLASNLELRTILSTVDTMVATKLMTLEERFHNRLSAMEDNLTQVTQELNQYKGIPVTLPMETTKAIPNQERKRKNPSLTEDEEEEGENDGSDSTKHGSRKCNVWEILKELHPKLVEGEELNTISIDRTIFSQPSEAAWCMKFVHVFWTPHDKATMKIATLSDNDLEEVTKSIQERMVKKIQELEGKVGKQTGRYQGFAKKVRQLEKEGKWKAATRYEQASWNIR